MNVLDDEPARREALDIRHSVLVRAPAGSGKTELLTQRALACLAVCRRPEEVLVLTFTNKAVNEARERIVLALESACSDEAESPHKQRTRDLARAVLRRDEEFGWSLRENPSRLRVMTIDKLNAEIASQLPVLSGFGGNARVDDHPERLYRQVVENLFEELEDPDLEPDARQSLEAVLQFAENRQGQLLPLLVALLTKRDQWLPRIHHADAFDMERVMQDLIVDRLARADALLGDSVRPRIAAVLQSASRHDLLAWARPIGAWRGNALSDLELWRGVATLLLTKSGELRKKVNKSNGFPAGEDDTDAFNAILVELHAHPKSAAVAAALDVVRRLPDPAYPPALDSFRVSVTRVLSRLVAHLQIVFETNGSVDFIEVAMRALAALGRNGEVTETLLRQDNSISHLLLDEAQDTSASQYELLERLTSGWSPGDGRSLFIVGDAQQSIYSFRQAEVGLFLRLWEEGRFGAIPLQTLTLTSNFRSARSIVSWFNDAFATIFPADPDVYASAVAFAASSATREDSPRAGVAVHAIAGDDAHEEARRVVDLIRECQDRDPEGTVAVLVRSRAHLRDILPAIKEAGIPFSCQDIDPLGNTAAVVDVLQLARALWHPGDRGAWFGLLRAPFVGVCWADCVALVRGHLDVPVPVRLRDPEAPGQLSEEGRRRIGRLVAAIDAADRDSSMAHSLPLRTESLWHVLGGPACVSKPEAKDVATFLALLRTECEGGSIRSLDHLLGAVRGLYASPENGTVQVMTLHKAKGLEFDTVIMPRLGRPSRRDDPPLLHHRSLPGGYLMAPHPGRRADPQSAEARLYGVLSDLEDAAQTNEALRLLYVGVTRARKRLHLVGSALIGGEDRAPRAASGSLLAHLWPVVQAHFAGLPVPSSQTVAPARVGVPLAPRLPVSWRYPSEFDVYRPALERAELPSEMVIHGARFIEEGGGENNEERIVGVLYHALMERIARDGLSAWSVERLGELRRSLEAGSRRLGMPEPQVAQGVERILDLAGRTIGSEKGRWLLDRHRDEACELALSGYIDDLWVSGVIDRTFIDDGDVLWVIDYKTSTIDSPDALRDEVVRYGPQLRRYANLRRRHLGRTTARAGVYFADVGEFVEVSV